MPRRKGGLWLPLDVNFFDDPRIVRAGERSALLYLAICCKCKALGNDGRLDPSMLPRLNVPGWQQRLVPLIREELILDVGDGFFTVAAWLRHNDPQVKVEAVRAQDRDRKKGTPPSGIRPESVRSRDVEKSREEKREVARPHGPCPGCTDADCPSRILRAVGDNT